MAIGSNWTCPFCDRPQVVTGGQSNSFLRKFTLSSHRFPNDVGIVCRAIACSNPDCGEITLFMTFVGGVYRGTTANKGEHFADRVDYDKFWRPTHSAKLQPDHIPQALREDYLEACKIRDLSPKASATLARRCLQGMIRDFCKISKAKLIDEIKELRKLVDDEKAPKGVSSESVDAIDHVRSIGNIGAHMEKDIDLIIDVDPNEAQILIELIETLFDEWYVERHQRTERFANLKAIADKKAAMKKGPQPVEAVEEVASQKGEG
jgi:hypothetical protein